MGKRFCSRPTSIRFNLNLFVVNRLNGQITQKPGAKAAPQIFELTVIFL